MSLPVKSKKHKRQELTQWQQDENSNPNLDTTTHDEVLKKLKTLESGPHSRRREAASKGELTKGEKARMNALLGTAQAQNTWVFNGNRDICEKLSPKDILPKQTLVFNDCHGCSYYLTAVTVKIFIQNCSDFKLIVDGSIRTQMLEVFKSKNVTLEIKTLIQTLQLDVCNPISIKFEKREYMGDIVWAGTENLRVSFDDCDESIHTGYSIAKPYYPNVKLNFERSQFYVRFVENKLRIERVIRLTNGFATTTREKKEYDRRQTINVEKLAALMGIKIGPKRQKREKGSDLPFSNDSAMSMWRNLK